MHVKTVDTVDKEKILMAIFPKSLCFNQDFFILSIEGRPSKVTRKLDRKWRIDSVVTGGSFYCTSDHICTHSIQ